MHVIRLWKYYIATFIIFLSGIEFQPGVGAYQRLEGGQGAQHQDPPLFPPQDYLAGH